MDNGDWLSLAGSLIGAAAAVGGAVWVEHYKRGLEARAYRQLLLDALGAFESTLAEFRKQHAQWRAGYPDLPGAKANILAILANLEEADDLLGDASRIVTAGSYAQLRTLYRLEKALARNEDTFRDEAEKVGIMRVTEAVLAIHYERTEPAVNDVARALADARSAWQR